MIEGFQMELALFQQTWDAGHPFLAVYVLVFYAIGMQIGVAIFCAPLWAPIMALCVWSQSLARRKAAHARKNRKEPVV